MSVGRAGRVESPAAAPTPPHWISFAAGSSQTNK